MAKLTHANKTVSPQPSSAQPIAPAKAVASSPSKRVNTASAKKPATSAAANTAAATKSTILPAKQASASDANQATPTVKVKTEKVKMQRDSFTMPKDEYAQIAALKKRLDGLQRAVKKSELLRAGLRLLTEANDAALFAAIEAVPVIKTGRPHKKH